MPKGIHMQNRETRRPHYSLQMATGRDTAHVLGRGPNFSGA